MKLSLILGIPISIFAVFAAVYLTQEVSMMEANEILVSYQSETVPKKVQCSGDARCIEGTVTQVIDGDTIKIDNQSVRFALASAPELSDQGGIEAKEFIEKLCPAGSAAIVDEDDLQTGGQELLKVVPSN